MTGPRPAEERIALWLEEEAAGFLPDRVLDATFARTRGLGQARRSAWRPFTMSRPIRALIAVGAAAIVVVLGAITLVPREPRTIVGIDPTSSPTPSASSTSRNLATETPQAVVPTFRSPLALTLPPGWRVVEDEPDRFLAGRLRPGPGFGPISNGVDLMLVAEVYADPCDTTRGLATSVGPTARELATWLTSIEPLKATVAIEPVSIDGTSAIKLDEAYRHVNTSAYAQGDIDTCPELALWPLASGDYRLFGEERLEFLVMDVGNERVVAVAVGMDDAEAMNAEARAVLETLTFR